MIIKLGAINCVKKWFRKTDIGERHEILRPYVKGLLTELQITLGANTVWEEARSRRICIHYTGQYLLKGTVSSSAG